MRSQMSFWWARAAIFTASAMSLSAASSRIWCRRVRPMSARRAGVEEVVLLPRHRDRLLVPGRLLRVDRVHPVPGRGQRLHPWPPVGLDHDHDLRRVRLAVLAPAGRDQLVEPGDPVHALRQPPPGQRLPGVVLHDHVVVAFGPVIADEQQLPALSVLTVTSGSIGENRQRPNGSSAHGRCRARHPISSPSSPVRRRGHGLYSGLHVRGLSSAHPPAATGDESPAPGIPPGAGDPLVPIRAPGS